MKSQFWKNLKFWNLNFWNLNLKISIFDNLNFEKSPLFGNLYIFSILSIIPVFEIFFDIQYFFLDKCNFSLVIHYYYPLAQNHTLCTPSLMHHWTIWICEKIVKFNCRWKKISILGYFRNEMSHYKSRIVCLIFFFCLIARLIVLLIFGTFYSYQKSAN